MKFKVGDKVSVKTWNEMLENERVQLDHRGDIWETGRSYTFGKRMRRFCGRVAIVREINLNNEIKLCFNEFGDVEFIFRDWMLEPKDI